MNIRIETVHTGAFSMNYFRFGSGEKTLVILPGLSVQSVMGAADAVEAAYRSMEDAFTVYLFDRRNELPPSYSVRDMARDTAAAFRALGLKEVCLFGASQGGMMAQVIAIEHPELVSKLVLGSSSSHVRDEQYRVIDNWVRLAKSGDRVGLYLSFGEELYPPAVFEQYREALIKTASTVTDEELKRFVTLAEGIRGFDVTDELEPPWRSRKSWMNGGISGSISTPDTGMRPMIPRPTIWTGSGAFLKSRAADAADRSGR